MDALNLRAIFPSDNAFGFPDLERCDWVPDYLGAWHMPRQRERAARENGAIHFFLDDYRFETAFTSPERTVGRVLAVGGALTPDFSLWRDMPRAAQIWNVYRSRWCGAFWQGQGVRVIPTVCWARPDTYDFCFEGLPRGGVVAVSALGVRATEEDQTWFQMGLSEMVSRLEPAIVLSYGKLRYVEGLDLPVVKEFPTFWDERRKVLKGE
ncbi:DUF4417 domain-containing protein [Mycolicibacterium sphagni]|nr:DUF4417 domain-containing protein [Mycolicibacterium sphagni]